MQIDNFEIIKRRALRESISFANLQNARDILLNVYGYNSAPICDQINEKLLQIKKQQHTSFEMTNYVLILFKADKRGIWVPGLSLERDTPIRFAITLEFFNKFLRNKSPVITGNGFVEIDNEHVYIITKENQNGIRIHYSEF